MKMQSKLHVYSANEVESKGFAKFNGGDHLCVDVPNGHFTVSCRLTNGRKITFAFCPYEENGIAKCVDIHDNGGKVIDHNDVNWSKGQTGNMQSLICFSGGGTAFRTGAEEKIVTLTTLLLKDKNDSD